VKKFLVLYMATVAAEQQQMNVSPEEMKKGMEPWLAWFKKYEKAFVDRGTQLVKGVHITKNKASEGKMKVTGYAIVQAEDVDAVKALLADGPYFMMMPEASAEVFEMTPTM
jgi:hypothetical protein